MEIKPPTKPGKNADEKALLAYHSELRRYHRLLEAEDTRLRQLSAEITKNSAAWKIERLKEIMNGSSVTSEDKKSLRGTKSTPKPSTITGPDCGCSIEAACDGCDCPECEQWRKDYKITDDMVEDWSMLQLKQHVKAMFLQKQAEHSPAPTTDEAAKFFAQYEEQMAHPERDDEQRTHN
jgi:hypothetical protein